MKLPFGIQLTRQDEINKTVEEAVSKALAHPGGSWSIIHDYFSGAFEQGLPAMTDSQMNSQACVYRCRTIIANSIAKLPLDQIQLMQGAWQKVPTEYPLLTRPSKIANRITWVSYVIHSMLGHGAAFGLKRFESGKLRYIELLHPSTEVLLSQAGDTFFRLSSNIYSHMPENQRTVPGEYIFHVPYNTLVHPLIGVPPLEASRAAAVSGSAIMSKQARTHGTKPEVHGFLKVPVTLTDAQAAAAKAAWQANNGVDGTGVGVLRNGVEYQPLQMTAKDSESSIALTLANEDIARAFGVPKHLLGIGTIPSAANAEALMLGFYAETLHPIAELIELALDEALELPANIGVEFDVKALSRLDSKGRAEAHQIELSSGKRAINEVRADDGLPPVPGGEIPYRQMQDIPVDQKPPEPQPVESVLDTTEEDELDKAQLYQLTEKAAKTEVVVGELKASMARLPQDVSAAVASSIAEVKSVADSLAADIDRQRDEFEKRLKAADDARSELEQKNQDELAEIRKELDSADQIKALQDLLSDERERRLAESAASRSDLEKLLKAADDKLLSLNEHYKTEIKSLRETAEDRSLVDALTKEVSALKDELSETRKSTDAQNVEMKSALQDAVASMGKALVEYTDTHKAELDKVAKSIADIPEIPEIPAELADIPETVKGMVAELTARVEAAEKMAEGCMKFAGTWDEGEEYGVGATIAHKNAVWIAMRDKPGVPGEKDSGWKMGMKSGRLITPYESR